MAAADGTAAAEDGMGEAGRITAADGTAADGMGEDGTGEGTDMVGAAPPPLAQSGSPPAR
jgi:hypothetical protein